MSKRFHDTEVWEKPWFRQLGAAEKLAFIYILDKCDGVGVWDPDKGLAEFYIGSRVSWDELAKKSNGNFMRLEDGKILVVDFCRYQYKKLNLKSPVHRRWVELMERRGLKDRFLPLLDNPLANPLAEPLRSSLPTSLSTLGQPPEEEEEVEVEVEDPSYLSPEKEKITRKTLGEPIEYDFKQHLWFGIEDAKVALWGEAYPACDVDLELRRMGTWLEANPEKRKVRNERFIVNWLKRAQDAGGSNAKKGGKW